MTSTQPGVKNISCENMGWQSTKSMTKQMQNYRYWLARPISCQLIQDGFKLISWD